MFEAAKMPDGGKVLAIFFELSEEFTNNGTNGNIFIKYLKKIENPSEFYEIEDKEHLFKVEQLIKHEVKEFYSYQGKNV